MCRGNWEIAALARHHISDLTKASQLRWLAEQRAHRPGGVLVHLRQRLGHLLVRAGQALAGASVQSGAWKPGAG